MGFFSLTLQVQYPVDLATVLTLLPPFGRSGLSAQSAPTRQQVEMQTPNVIQPDHGPIQIRRTGVGCLQGLLPAAGSAFPRPKRTPLRAVPAARVAKVISPRHSTASYAGFTLS